MNTDALVDRLTGGRLPVSQHAMRRRIAAGVAVGAIAAAVLLLSFCGVRPDLAQAAHTPGFWLKGAFTSTLGWAAFLLAEALGRPGGRVGQGWWGLAAPVLVALALAASETVEAPARHRGELWLGQTAAQCPLVILALSVPAFAGVIWAYRRFAPTRLRLAGCAAGLLAATVGA